MKESEYPLSGSHNPLFRADLGNLSFPVCQKMPSTILLVPQSSFGPCWQCLSGMKWLQNLTCIVARLRYLPQQIFVLKGRWLHPTHLSKYSVKTLLCPADHKSSGGEMRLKSEEEEEEEEEEEDHKTM